MYSDTLDKFKYGSKKPVRCVIRNGVCIIQFDTDEFITYSMRNVKNIKYPRKAPKCLTSDLL